MNVLGGPRRVRCPWAPNILATPLSLHRSHWCIAPGKNRYAIPAFDLTRLGLLYFAPDYYSTLIHVTGYNININVMLFF